MSVPFTPRRIARHFAVDAASTASLPNRNKALARPRVHFLFAHAVMPKDVHRFDKLVRRLSATHDLLGHSEAISRIRNGEIARPAVSFSFDDGLQSNLLAASVLERHGTTGTFFVPTDFIGTKTTAEARQFFGHSTEINEPAMTWADLETLKSRGHEIGNHTAKHLTLSDITIGEAKEDISRGAEMLRTRLGECRHFAWPRGAFKFFPNELRETVFESGHETCNSAVRGAHVAASTDITQLCIRRDLIASYWPTRHNLYFISNSAQNSTVSNNDWPVD